MGNRNGGSRPKTRDNKYKYSNNNYNNGVTNKGAGGTYNPQLYPSQVNGYNPHHTHPYPLSYGQNLLHSPGNAQSPYNANSLPYQANNQKTNNSSKIQ